jgi:hypothetical protein
MINPMRPSRSDVSRLNAAPRCAAKSKRRANVVEALPFVDGAHAECLLVPAVALLAENLTVIIATAATQWKQSL